MKKILIATTALVAISAPTAFALDVSTTGAVEYRYTKDKVGQKAQNPKLSQKDANIKFAAEGASNGMGYGASVKIKSGTSTIEHTAAGDTTTYGHDVAGGAKKGYELTDGLNKLNLSGDTAAKTKALFKKVHNKFKIGVTDFANDEKGEFWSKIGKTQDGKDVYALFQYTGLTKAGTAGALNTAASKLMFSNVDNINKNADGEGIGGIAIGKDPSGSGASLDTPKEVSAHSEPNGAAASSAVNKNIANNATTQSDFWVSGSWGKFVVGQSGSAAGDLAISGAVKAASYAAGTHVASAGADQTQDERWTYTAPTIIDGLSIGYTSSFKGNVDTDKSKRAKASTNWGIKYSTDIAGVSLAVAHASGTTSKTGSDKAQTNTQTGATATYGNFTVGYGVFDNDKKAHQTKGTSGSAYGVKYASGAWSVGYTVQDSEDTNKYITHSNKSATTSAYSASYSIAEGFSMYASKSSNSVKSTSGKTAKNNFTIIGAKVSF